MLNCIFDFNGTMIFDQEIQNNSWKTYLEDKIGREVIEEEFQKYVHGVSSINTFEYFFKRKYLPDEALEIAEEKEKIYRDMCLENPNFCLAPGLVDFLDYLKESKIPRTIATASPYNNTKFFFDKLDLYNWFDFDKVVFNDGKIKGKPNPDLFLLAAKNLNVDIHDCVVFEDSKSGIKAAKNAGVKKIIVVDSMGVGYKKEDNILVLKDYLDTKNIIDFLV